MVRIYITTKATARTISRTIQLGTFLFIVKYRDFQKTICPALMVIDRRRLRDVFMVNNLKHKEGVRRGTPSCLAKSPCGWWLSNKDGRSELLDG